MTRAREEALRELCSQLWPAIDQQVAEALGLPSWETPQHTRQEVTDGFCRDREVRQYNPANPSDRHLLTQAFQGRAFPTAKATARAVIHAAVQVPSRTLAALRRKFRVTNVPKAPGPRPTRLQKADARNLELAWFVVERIIPFSQLLAPRLDKRGKDVRLLPGHRGPQVSVPRQALAEEWNRTHPWWPMSGDVLMRQFYRAAGRAHLARELLSQLQSEIAEAWDKSKRDRESYREWYANLTAEERAKFEKTPADVKAYFSSPKGMAAAAKVEEALRKSQESLRKLKRVPGAFEKCQRQLLARIERYRAGLTRKDLLKHRLSWVTVSALRHEGSKREQQHWQAPLREWFLPEARGEPPTLWTGLGFMESLMLRPLLVAR
jgi:cytochrome b561